MSRDRYIVEQCAIVVLAAGMSSRLGSPKQLLRYKGKSLLQHSVDAALHSTMRPVIVVVGANKDLIKDGIQLADVIVTENDVWTEGLASSLRCGVAAVEKITMAIDGVLFMVCDQPYVTTQLLESLLNVQRDSGLPIVASSYGDSVGIPALFHKCLFAELMALTGDTGAKKLINLHNDQVITVPFEKGNIDIDTAADYDALFT